jgi:hypothetical protein
MKKAAVLTLLFLAARTALANEAPVIDHQATSCTEATAPISLCATIADDKEIARAKVYFRKPGEKYYVFADMTFGGLGYCGTLPAPVGLKTIEYYLQATDNEYESARTSTYQMEVKPAGSCDFPAVEKDPARRAAIKVHGTDPRQGTKLPKGYDSVGVTFVPARK